MDNKIKTAEEIEWTIKNEILEWHEGKYDNVQELFEKVIKPHLSYHKKEYNGLPSDEEINDYGWKWSDGNNGHGPDKYFSGCNFVCGAKWMREIASSEIEALKAEIAEKSKNVEEKDIALLEIQKQLEYAASVIKSLLLKNTKHLKTL